MPHSDRIHVIIQKLCQSGLRVAGIVHQQYLRHFRPGYRICDETGMLVWDEMPVSFYATFRDEKWRINYEQQLKRMIRKQNYHPSVIVFSTFNESWGISGDQVRLIVLDMHTDQVIAIFFRLSDVKFHAESAHQQGWPCG